ncbi:MAG: hypothetical protein K9J79_08345 [Desulfobacteraceae bacterium]|nr:hypothetical protein [Desulfobacteraceae bacterium]
MAKQVDQKEVNPSVKRLQARIMRWLNHYHESMYDEPTRPLFKRYSGCLRPLGLTPNKLVRNRFKFLSLFGKDVVDQEEIDWANLYYQQDWEWVQKNVGMIGNIL